MMSRLLEQSPSMFYGPLKIGKFEFVSKISQKLFELMA